MKINLITIGNKMSKWVDNAVYEYSKRLPKELQFNCIELPLKKHNKTTSIETIKQHEWQQIQKALPKKGITIALDEHGHEWATSELAQQLQTWHEEQREINLIVGGPDGLAKKCLQHAQHHWSLSKLTMPHPLVRIIITEQLYRAWTILIGHPYHRS